jgi:hypothetical protein
MVAKLKASNIVTIEKSNPLYRKQIDLSVKCRNNGLMHDIDYRWYYGPDVLHFEFKEEKDASYFALTCL